AAPEDDDGAIGQEPGVVAGNGVANSADHRERARRLRSVLVIPERDPALAPHPADLLRPGLQEPGEILAQHDAALHGEAAGGDLLSRPARLRAMRARLRRPESIHHGGMRYALEERLLVVRRQDRPARADDEQARKIVGPAIEP